MGFATMGEVLWEVPLAALRKAGFLAREVDGREILVLDTPSGVRVYSGVCPHLGGPLARARVRDGRIRCPWHRYEFDAVDGRCLTVPGGPWRDLPGRLATRPPELRLRPFPFEVSGDSIRVLDPDPE